MNRIHVNDLPRKADGTKDFGSIPAIMEAAQVARGMQPGMVSRPANHLPDAGNMIDHLADAGKKVRAKARDLEGPLQAAMVKAVETIYAKAFATHQMKWTHIPHGGQRTKAAGGKLKAQGVRPGWPDLLLCVGPLHVHIEVKTPEGELTLEQKQHAAYCRMHSIPHHVVRSVDDLLAVVLTHYTTVYPPFA